MKSPFSNLDNRLAIAIQQFWRGQTGQSKNKRRKQRQNDLTDSASYSGNQYLGSFRDLMEEILVRSGIQEVQISWRRKFESPGLPGIEHGEFLATVDNKLVALIEVHSQIGSFSNTVFNNRISESTSRANDIWSAYKEGAFKLSERPWIGFILLLEEINESSNLLQLKRSRLNVFSDFGNAGFPERCDRLITKLVRSRLYDASCFLISSRDEGKSGKYREPNLELSFRTFVTSLLGRAIAVVQMQLPSSSEPQKMEIGRIY